MIAITHVVRHETIDQTLSVALKRSQSRSETLKIARHTLFKFLPLIIWFRFRVSWGNGVERTSDLGFIVDSTHVTRASALHDVHDLVVICCLATSLVLRGGSFRYVRSLAMVLERL